jgi:hypothetical protein
MPKPKSTAKKTGRPRKELDLALIENLAMIQCTDSEIAAALNVSVDTITRRKKEPTFADAYERGKQGGKRSLRRLQWLSAEKGGFVMQIWLGKQYLGQQDRQTTHIEGLDLAALVGQLGALLGQFIRDFIPPDHWDEARQRIKDLNVGEPPADRRSASTVH